MTRKDTPEIDLSKEVITLPNGQRLTDELAAEIAEYSVTEAEKARGRGRPSLTGTKQRAAQVTFKLTPALRAKAEARAEAEGRKLGELARAALEQYLGQDNVVPLRRTATVKRTPTRVAAKSAARTAAKKAPVRTAAKKASKPALSKTTQRPVQ